MSDTNSGDLEGMPAGLKPASPTTTHQPVWLSESGLDEALLTMRPQVWQDISQQVMLGEIPAAQLPMKVEMWERSFRPFLAKAIETYLKCVPEREVSTLYADENCPLCKRETTASYYKSWSRHIDCKGCGFHDLHGILGEPPYSAKIEG